MVELDVIVAIPDRYNDLSDEDVGDLASDSFLVNGRGRYNNNKAPLSVHKVQAGDTYMFRIINVGFDNMFEVGKYCDGLLYAACFLPIKNLAYGLPCSLFLSFQ